MKYLAQFKGIRLKFYLFVPGTHKSRTENLTTEYKGGNTITYITYHEIFITFFFYRFCFF